MLVTVQTSLTKILKIICNEAISQQKKRGMMPSTTCFKRFVSGDVEDGGWEVRNLFFLASWMEHT